MEKRLVSHIVFLVITLLLGQNVYAKGVVNEAQLIKSELGDSFLLEDAWLVAGRGGKNKYKKKHKNKKVTICHIPHGNPARAKTIRVSAKAAKKHLRHGDYRGKCRHRRPGIRPQPVIVAPPPITPRAPLLVPIPPRGGGWVDDRRRYND